MGCCPGWHLAGGGMRHPHKKNVMVTFAISVFYRSFAPCVNDIMSPCGSINLVRVGALTLVWKLGRLLPGKVSHSEVRDREGVGVGWPQVERRNLSNSTHLILYSTVQLVKPVHTTECYQINCNSYIILWILSFTDKWLIDTTFLFVGPPRAPYNHHWDYWHRIVFTKHAVRLV